MIVADDSTLLREGLARLLAEAGMEVVESVGDADALLAAAGRHRPDVAVVDIRMPPTRTDDGLRAARTIRERYPEVGVLVLSQYARMSYAMELLGTRPEGVGYLLKDRISDVDEFTAAVRRVAAGGSALDPVIVAQLVGRRSRPDDHLTTLSEREREVLSLVAEGRSNRAIAQRLSIAERTVEKHCTAVFAKLRVPAGSDDHRRVLAVLAYLHG